MYWPEWYFLPFYVILGSIQSIAGGISAMGGSNSSVFFIFPIIYIEKKPCVLYF